jgi:large subunit ribosomal protein L18
LANNATTNETTNRSTPDEQDQPQGNPPSHSRPHPQEGCRHHSASIHYSNQHVYAQVIDDSIGCTLVAASTLDKEMENASSNIASAEKVGSLIAQRAKAANISAVVFDRGGHLYHGKVKALAEAAREAGLQF